MSHVVTCETEFNDTAALKAACERLGWTFHEGQTSYRWFGAWVGDTPVPEWLCEGAVELEAERLRLREERAFAPGHPQHGSWDALQARMTAECSKCSHAISIPGCSYQVGLRLVGKSLRPVWDYYDGNMLKAMGTDGNVLRQAYAVEATRNAARRQGLRVLSELKQPDGSVRLVCG